MNTKTCSHTPGPWHVMADPAWAGKHPLHDARFVATSIYVEVTDCDDEKGWRFTNDSDSIICTMPDSEAQKANARLIAAAPQMLAALQSISDDCLEGLTGVLQSDTSAMLRAILGTAQDAISTAINNDR